MAEVRGDDPKVPFRLAQIPGVRSVSRSGAHLAIRVDDGPGALSPVALALDACDLDVQSITLRTPTLDDVFFELTGHQMADEP